MAIITISRGSYSKGKEVAEKVAKNLGYTCLSRGGVIEEASNQWKIPKVKLVRAVHDAPGILERLGYSKEKYVVYLQAATLKHFKEDNVVYHGLAGHFMVKGVHHVLKVRILANIEDRVREEIKREKISRKEALDILRRDDEARRRWSKYLFGIETSDPYSYDLVIHVNKMTTDDAVDVICHTAKLPSFRTTPESQKIMDDLALASEVKAVLIGFRPNIEVFADQGLIVVEMRSRLTSEKRSVEEIRKIIGDVPGVKEVQVKVHLNVDIP